jgi:hypothetical protein
LASLASNTGLLVYGYPARSLLAFPLEAAEMRRGLYPACDVGRSATVNQSAAAQRRTERHKAIADLRAAGHTQVEIAEKVGVCVVTAHSQRGSYIKPAAPDGDTQ